VRHRIGKRKHSGGGTRSPGSKLERLRMVTLVENHSHYTVLLLDSVIETLLSRGVNNNFNLLADKIYIKIRSSKSRLKSLNKGGDN
jgi:hypothetical protein